MERLECYIGCIKCNVVLGKVIAKTRADNDQVWINIPVSDPTKNIIGNQFPKYCLVCSSPIERLP